MKLLFIIASCIFLTSFSHAQDWEWIGGPGGTTGFYEIGAAPNGALFLICDGIRRSTDGGKTWRLLLNRVSDPEIQFDTNGAIYIVSRDFFFKLSNKHLVSTTNGDTWTQFESRNGYLKVSPSGILAIASRDSLSISTDQGQTWEHSALPYANTDYPMISFDKSENLYLWYHDDSLWRSTSYGNSWEYVGRTGPVRPVISPRSRVLFGISGRSMYRSNDSGATWTFVYESISPIRSVYVADEDTTLLLNDAQKIDRSTDGGTSWQRYDSQLAATNYPIMVLANRGQVFVMFNEVLVTRSDTGTSKWSVINVANGRVTHLATAQDMLFAAVYNIGLWTHDSSSVWNKDDNAAGNLSDLAVDSADGFYIADSRLRVTTDNGTSWTFKHSSGANQVAFSNTYAYILFGKQKFRTQNFSAFEQIHDTSTYFSLCATAEPGFVYTATLAPALLRSTDHGTTWEEALFPFIIGSGMITDIESVGEQVIVAVGRTGVYFSSDYGVTWENHSVGLAQDTISDLLLTPGGTVFATARTGLYAFDPLAKTWTNVGGGVLARRPYSLALGREGKVYVGTDGDGVYRSMKSYGTWGPPTVTVLVLPTVAAITLVPNPASTEVTIIGSDEAISKIAIYNTLGQCLKTIDGDALETERFSIASLPNGSYLVRLTTGATIRSQVLIIGQ